jgi:hypothetical protein
LDAALGSRNDAGAGGGGQVGQLHVLEVGPQPPTRFSSGA